jgi:hypothetical protein
MFCTKPGARAKPAAAVATTCMSVATASAVSGSYPGRPYHLVVSQHVYRWGPPPGPPRAPPPPPQHRQLSAGDQLRVIYENLSKDPNSLANLDQVRCACTAAAIFFGGGGAQLSGVR